MLTMTRPPPDSFLPSSYNNKDMHVSLAGLTFNHSPNVVSPLSLPPRATDFHTPESLTSTRVQRFPSPRRGSPRQQIMQGSDSAMDSDRISRLEAQNAIMKKAWEEERRALQNTRDVAETVYQQERELWQSERADLLSQLSQLQSQLAEQTIRQASPDRRQRQLPGAHSFALQRALSPGGRSPRTHPVSSTFVPLNNIPTESSSDSRHDSTDSSNSRMSGQEAPVPTIDISEVHPHLEGIIIKKDAVQRETFTDGPSSSSASGSKPSSRNTSPPSDPESPKEAAREKTLQALSVEPHRRLTIHAGHTPTVSLSAVPSLTGTAISNTANSSGSSTPTRSEAAAPLGDHTPAVDPELAVEPHIVPTESTKDQIHGATQLLETSEEDDRTLTGPLMLRNMPAKDELFLETLNKKLDKVESGEDATPTVLRNSDDEYEGDDGELPSLDQVRAMLGRPKGDKKPEDDEEPAVKASEDIPLRLKPSRNFGAPFGQFR